MTVGPYEAPPPPGSFHGDYAYDAYMSNFSSAQGFPEYGYPADAGWPAVEQGVCGQGPGCPQVQGARSPLGRLTSLGREMGVSCDRAFVMAWPGPPRSRDSCVTARPS